MEVLGDGRHHQRQRQRQTETEGETEGDRDRQRQRERETERERGGGGSRETDIISTRKLVMMYDHSSPLNIRKLISTNHPHRDRRNEGDGVARLSRVQQGLSTSRHQGCMMLNTWTTG